MKVIHLPFCFYPDSGGGTEVYVEALALSLKRHGIEVVIAAPSEKSSHYLHNGLAVCRFALAERVVDLRELYGEGDKQAAQEFGRILDDHGPALVHLHAFTRGVSLLLVREAKKRGIPVVFTYHTPTVSCQRGTLMRWGKDVCDGRLDVDTCTRCTLQGLGLPRGVADFVGRVPVIAGRALGRIKRRGGVWTALRMRELISERRTVFHLFMREVDHVVAVCQWVRDLLILNGVPQEKVTLCRQGLAQERVEGGEKKEGKFLERDPLNVTDSQLPLRIAFLGRLHPTKGVHILIRAIQRIVDLPITLDVYGVPQEGRADKAYMRYLRKLASEDKRITFCPPIPADDVVHYLQRYDLLAAPSQWLETGPLVILESFAAGVPVMGSNLGGIAELVEEGVNGLLVEPPSIEAWSEALRRISENPGLLTGLRKGIRPPRQMDEVGEEMIALYRTLLKARPTRNENSYSRKPSI